MHNVTLSPETKVLVWISSQNVKAVAEKGFKLIHAASDYFYLVRPVPSPSLPPTASSLTLTHTPHRIAATAAGSATSPRGTAGATRSRRGSTRTRSTRPRT